MKTGLIAGYGAIPVVAAENLIKQGHELFIIALYEEVTADFSNLKDVEIRKFSVTQVGRIIKCLKENDVDKVLFAGKVNKSLLFSDLKFDLTAIKLLAATANRKDDTLMNAICNEMTANGITVMKQTEALGSLFVKKGVYSKKETFRRSDGRCRIRASDSQRAWSYRCRANCCCQK